MSKQILNGTVGKVEVMEAHEDGSVTLRVTPADNFELSTSKKSYAGAFANDKLAIGGESVTLMVQYYIGIPKAARTEGASLTKRNPFRKGA